MKFLADMGVSPLTVAFLRSMGHEAVRLPEVGLAEASDADVIARAARENEIVVTFDLDYPALLALRRAARVSAIVFRTFSADPLWINTRLTDCLPRIIQPLAKGAIVVIEDDRVRIRLSIEL